MTIDEAIEEYKKRVENDRQAESLYLHDDLIWNAKQENKLAEHHEQLAEWLEELKILKQETEQDIYERAYAEGRDKGYYCGKFNGYNKAIDDFAERLKQEYQPCKDTDNETYKNVCKRFDEIAQQLKVGGTDAQTPMD